MKHVERTLTTDTPRLPPGLKILGDRVASCLQVKLDALGSASAAGGSATVPQGGAA